MDKMKEQAVKAKKLLQDDYILVAGQLYRIARVKKSKDTNEVKIQAYPVSMLPSRSITLFVERSVMFIIYNQI
jgi:hypothetical protein